MTAGRTPVPPRAGREGRAGWIDRLATRSTGGYLARYGIGLLVGMLSISLTIAAYQLTGVRYGAIYLVAIALVGVIAGRGPGLFVTLVVAVPFVLGQSGSLSRLDELTNRDLVTVVVILGCGTLLALIGSAARETAVRLARAHRQAEEALELAEENAARAEESASEAELSALNASEALSGQEAAFAQLDAVVRTAPVGIGFITRDLTYARINEQMAEVHGLPIGAHLGKQIRDVVPEVADAMESMIRHVFHTGEPMLDREFEASTPGQPGVRRWFWCSVFPVRDQSGGTELVAKLVQDITARKKAEAALRTSEGRYRALLEANTAIVWVCDAAGAFVEPQPAWERYTGQTWEQHRGNGWAGVVHPEDRDRLLAAWDRALKSGTRYEIEARLWHAEADAYRRAVLRAVPILREDGAVREWVGMVTDVEEQRRAEDELRHGQKMQAIGSLAGGVAHEVNNQVTGVLGFAGFLSRRFPEGSPEADDLQQVVRGADRIATVTRQLLAFSRQQLLQPRRIDLNGLVRDLEPLLVRLIAKDVRIVTDLVAGEAPVRADRHQLEQVLLNLALNARDALGPGGTITIATANAGADEVRLAARGSQPRASEAFVVLRLGDTGRGITPEVLPRIFEPFFTTKAPGEGTGLGLSTVYGIVRQSGGYITVDSTPGEGSVFSVFLPRQDSPDELGQSEAEITDASGRETLLVVDDEEVICSFAERVLREQGYRVLTARDAHTALALLETEPGREVMLVVTDVVMPGMGGEELGQEIEARRPGLPVLYMSGFSAEHTTQRGLLRPGLPLIQKPFSPEAILVQVRRMLDGGSVPA